MQASSVCPLLQTALPLLQQFHRSLGPSAPALSGTMHYASIQPASNVPNLEEPPGLFLEDQTPLSGHMSNRGDSPHFGRESLLEPPLQVLHVG